MKITLLLFFLLFVSVNCYYCSYENPILYVIKGVYTSSSRLICDFEVKSIRVEKYLPYSLLINSNGIIYGTLNNSLSETFNAVVIITEKTNHREMRARLMIKEINQLTSCTYDVNIKQFMINFPNYIRPPSCDSVVTKFSVVGLPYDIKINEETGEIRGTAENAKPAFNQSAIIKAEGIPGGGSVKITIIYNIIDPSSDNASYGIVSRFAYDQPEWDNKIYPIIYNNFEDSYITHYTNIFNETIYKCNADSPCLMIGGNVEKKYGKWTASLYLPEQGDYIFRYKAEDNIVLYLDDMNKNIGEVSTSNTLKNFTITVHRAGFHAFSMLSYSRKINSSIEVTMKMPSSKIFRPLGFKDLRYPYLKYYTFGKSMLIKSGGIVKKTFDFFDEVVGRKGSKVNAIRIYNTDSCIFGVSLVYDNFTELPKISYRGLIDLVEYNLYEEELIKIITTDINYNPETKCFTYISFLTSRGRLLESKIKTYDKKSEIVLDKKIIALYGNLNGYDVLNEIGFYYEE